MFKIPCTNCSEKEECTVYKILNNTLDNSKEHRKITLQLDFLVTLNEPEEFEDDWKEDIAKGIAENTMQLSNIIVEKLEEYNNTVQSLGAHLNVACITNRRAFDEVARYIKVTHD